jgi:hypothetical protein
MEMASAQQIKQTKKAMFHPIVTMTTMGHDSRASDSKVVAIMKKLWCLLRNAVFLLLVLWQRRL